MACKRFEPFESRAAITSYFITSSGASIQTAAAYDGETGLQILGNSLGVMEIDGTSYTEGWHHFKWKPFTLGSSGAIFLWRATGTDLGSIRLNTTSNKLEIWTTTLQSTLAPTITGNVWYDIQLRVKIDDSAGVIELKLNGVTQTAFTGDTKPGSDTQFNRIVFTSGASAVNYFDNYWFDDAGYKGIIRVETKRPTANGDDTAWTGSYTDVDDVTPDGDTTVLSSLTNNQESSVKFAATSILSSSTILAVAHEHGAKLLTAGDITFGVKEGGTKTYEGAARTLGIDYAQYFAIWETNPRTSAASITSELDGGSSAVQAYIKSGGM